MKAGSDASDKNKDPGLDVDDDDGIIVCYNAKKEDDDDKIEPLPAVVDRKRGREEEGEGSNKH